MQKNKYTMTLDMVLEYTKIFDQEGKPGDIDRGDPKSSEKWLRDLAKNPKATGNFYFTSEEQIEFLENYEGFERMVNNPKTGAEVDRIKEGNPDLGIGKYIVLTRRMEDLKEFVNKKGELQELDKGGVPSVKILTPTEDGTGEVFVEYDYDELGAPSNGTEAKVRFEPRYMRLEAIGITNLIEYVDGEGFGEEDF